MSPDAVSVPKKPVSFDLEFVTQAVANSRFSEKLQHFATIGSTNLHAIDAASVGAPDGSVFVADEQTAGRGRGGHSWHSTAGNGLYVSAIVRPKMELSKALWLSLASGLAAQRAVREAAAQRADIRWPNDLLLGSRKCGGILVETASSPGTAAQLRFAVIGIGINVNHGSFPAELKDIATSLRLESGSFISRESLLASLLLALDAELELLESELHGFGHCKPLLERFTAASSWVAGKRVRVEERDGYTGVTAGLDRDGFLQIAGDDGVLHTALSGGVRAYEG